MNGLKRWTVRHAGLLLLWASFPVGPLSALGLSVGDRVQTTGGVVVYQTPGAGKVGTQATGSLGVAMSGPQIATLNGVIYLWWNISFDLGSSGWVQQDFVTSIVPSAPVLASPGALTAPGPGVATLTPTFSWNADRGATNYIIFVVDLTIGGFTIYYNDSLGNVTSFSLPGGYLTVGHSYYWILEAQDSVGFSASSNPLYFQAQTPPPPVPALISPGTVTGPGPTITTLTPTLTWSASSGATGYGVYVYDFAGHAYVYSNDSVGNVTSLTLASGTLAASRSYAWQMRASSAAGFSGYSSYLFFQTTAVPPTLVFRLSATNIILSWPTNASGFTLESASSLSAASWTAVSPGPSVAGTSYVVTNDLSGVLKLFRLKK